MADTFVYSNDQANMRDYAVWMQAPAGTTAYNWSVGDLRTLIAPACPSAGVANPDDFNVTTTSANTVTVSAGVGVTAPTGIAGASAQERYVFAASGPVDVPIPANGGGTSLFHRLIAQVDDQQLAMGVSDSAWCYRLMLDTGSGMPSAANMNAISLAQVKVNPGQSSGYTITDLRDPCGHQCGVTLSRSTSLAVPNGSGEADRDGIHFIAEDDDPWHLTTLNSGGTQIFLRHPGIWDLQVSAVFSGVTTWGEIGIGVNGITGTLLAQNKGDAIPNGNILTATALGVKIIPGAGYYVEPYSLAGNTGVTMTGLRFSAYRRMYRAS
ncbi:MAG TPA: hypothetical protein VE326_11460 [Candidatus Binatia bacterium]|nr:hypothetical protein [Candidatus Binatia bacterium]